MDIGERLVPALDDFVHHTLVVTFYTAFTGVDAVVDSIMVWSVAMRFGMTMNMIGVS